MAGEPPLTFGPPLSREDTTPREKKLDVDIRSGQQNIQKSQADIANDRERIRLDREKFLLDLAAKGLMIDDKGEIVPRPGGAVGVSTRPAESPERTKALAQIGAARDLDKSIVELERLFYRGPGRTRGIMGGKDYLPLVANKRFDKAAEANRGVIKKALALTGGELNTAAEAEAALGPYIPSSKAYDKTNIDAFNRLRQKRDEAWRLGIQTLGGIPDVNGVVTPLDPSKVTDALQVAPWLQREQKRPKTEDEIATAAATGAQPETAYPPEASAFNQAMAVTAPLVAAGTDTTEVSKPIPEEMQQEMQEWFAQHPRGSLSIEDFANFRNALDAKYGYGKRDYTDPGSVEFVKNYNSSAPLNTAIPPPLAPDTRNALEKVAGAAVMSPVGTTAATALSGAGLNLADLALSDEMQALRELNPNAAVLGDVLGSVGGASALSKAGSNVAEKLFSKSAPELYRKIMSGGKGATIARQMLNDVAQGTIYGGAVEGDAGTGAVSGATGNVMGLGFGKIGGAFLRGLKRTPEADLLIKYGVPDLTVGQQLGGVSKRVEDAATSLPVAGDVINARRGESLLSANRAAFQQVAGEPIGLGEDALKELARRREKAYTDALGGHIFDLNNPQFTAEMAQALAARGQLTDEFATKFDQAVKNAVAETPIGQGGTMTGEQYQQAQRRLSGYKGETTKPGFEKDYRDALSGVSSALRGEVERQAPEVIPALSAADKMYRGEKILQDAINRAKFDTMNLGADVFRPGDLTSAVSKSKLKYPGEVPLADFAEAAQSVLPSKLPDSGTARRAMFGALTLGGVGAVTGSGSSAAEGGNLSDIVTSGGAGAAVPLATLGLLAAGGTRGGQRALSKLLFDRPQTAKVLGNLTEKYAPKVGTGLIPFVMQGTQPDTSEVGWYDPETDTLVLPDGSRIKRDGTPVAKKASGGSAKKAPARTRDELYSRYLG